MNNKVMTATLKKVQDALRHKRTTTARRRYPAEQDEDLIVPGVDPFLIDAEVKIAQSQAVRRLGNKTQVMTSPANTHIRTRITHTGEVTANAAFISAILGLNVELAKAIGLCHDIGHPPFGHDGEALLAKLSKRPFTHELMGVVIAQHIERHGHGLNLTHEVLAGLIREGAMSEEAKSVMWGDRFAYVTGDYNDMMRVGYPIPMELGKLMSKLGSNQRARVNLLVSALCVESADAGEVSFSKSDVAQMFARVKKLMYEQYDRLNASNGVSILKRIYEFIGRIFPEIDRTLLVALMTDQDVLHLASQPVLDFSRFQQTTAAELVPLLVSKKIEWWKPDLSW